MIMFCFGTRTAVNYFSDKCDRFATKFLELFFWNQFHLIFKLDIFRLTRSQKCDFLMAQIEPWFRSSKRSCKRKNLLNSTGRWLSLRFTIHNVSVEELIRVDLRVRGEHIKALLGVNRSVFVRYGSKKPRQGGPSPSTGFCF